MLLKEARAVVPGGVNSPVRSFGAVGGRPPFISRARGSRLWDEEGREFIDYVGSWGPAITGHAPEAVVRAVQQAAPDGLSFGAPTVRETQLARKIVEMVPSVEMVRLVNSGTEAAMSAVRLARGYTGRDSIIKFEGCYHGHSDALLAAAGSGVLTLGIPASAGVPRGSAADAVTVPYNDVDAFHAAALALGDRLAAVMVEPVAANMGCVPPVDGFLETLRSVCSASGALLVFDEVITGFRLAPGGAQDLYGITPDLTIMGKVLGAGLPLAAFGGRREIMELLAPLGPVYQAGTLSGNPVATAAALAQLDLLCPEVYRTLEERSDALALGLIEAIRKSHHPLSVQRVGSVLTLFFAPGPVLDYADAKSSNVAAFAAFHAGMLKRGVYLPASQFECWFVSSAHSSADIQITIEAAREALREASEVML